jgi:hypothetical protein
VNSVLVLVYYPSGSPHNANFTLIADTSILAFIAT